MRLREPSSQALGLGRELQLLQEWRLPPCSESEKWNGAAARERPSVR